MAFLDFLNPVTALLSPLERFSKQLTDAYVKRAELQHRADTDREKMANDLKIKTLEARMEVMVKEPPFGMNSIVRALAIAPAIIYIWKLIVWDKVLNLGATDDLSPELWTLVALMYGFYFLGEVVLLMKRK